MSRYNSIIPKVRMIEALSEEHKAQVDSMLLADLPVPSEVLPVVRTFEELESYSDTAIQKNLYRYKSAVIEPKQLLIAEKYSSNKQGALTRAATNVRKLKVAFEPLKEMEEVAAQQMERVKKLAKLEENSPALLESQTKNIVALATILEKVAKIHHDLGILKHSAPVEYKGIGKDSAAYVRGASITPITKQSYDTATLRALANLQRRGLVSSNTGSLVEEEDSEGAE